MSRQLPGLTVQSNRLAWIDYARGIAIILVLYRHIFEGITRSGVDDSKFQWLENANIIFYSFRMPLFFILSGIFIAKSLAKRKMKGLILNKVNILLYPYLLWSALQITIQILLSGYVNADRGWVDYAYILAFPRRIDQFWYLYALFNVTVLYIIMREKLRFNAWHQLLLGGAMYMASSYVAIRHIDLGFIYDILHYYMFFAIGELVAGKILDNANFKLFSSWKLMLGLLPFFAAGQLYFLLTNLDHRSALYVEEHQPLLFGLIALCGCAFMISISFILQKYGRLKLLRVAGYHSLYIYVSHVLVASAVRMVMVKVLGVTYLPALLIVCLLFAVTVPVLMYQLAMRAGLWWLYSLERPDAKAAMN